MSGAVWIVEHGEYSSYQVVGVFSSEENAQLIADAIGGTVDKRTLDPAVEELRANMRQFVVWMQKDGTTDRCEESDVASWDIEGSMFVTRNCLIATVWAKNSEHAIKIANEGRAQMIASNAWSQWDEVTS